MITGIQLRTPPLQFFNLPDVSISRVKIYIKKEILDAYLQPHLNRKFNSLQHQQLTSSVPQFGRFIVIRSARQKDNSSDKGNLHQKRDISRRSKGKSSKSFIFKELVHDIAGLFLPIESKVSLSLQNSSIYI